MVHHKMQIRKLNRQELRLRLVVALLSFMTLVGLAFQAGPGSTAQAAGPDFANDYFHNTWNRTDYPIAQGQTSRSWYWGPQPVSGGILENYAQSPNGKRQVQYFDKARMEINNPSTKQVTNGLLVVEMISGRRQEGDNTFVNTQAANVPIAGDPDNTWPTYAGLSGAFLKPQNTPVGQPVTFSWNVGGLEKQPNYKSDPNTFIAVRQNGLGIPTAFWNFLNRKGSVYANGNYQQDTISDWLFSTGLPVTEAYWTQVRVGGQVKDVLFQAFERRTLTYTPSNPADFQVEMGNVGLHYIKWRYPNGLPQALPNNPLAGIFAGDQPSWYEVTADALNVRTAPNTTAPLVSPTEDLPYLQRLFKGNHVQPIRAVKGEELEKGNDTWFQFYENPDMFVYSGYLKKLTLDNYPTPPRGHKGVWVSVDLSKQMMAVFSDDTLIYKTLIASGVPNYNDPDKDHSTPTGVYKIIGSYRPKTQTMEGGEGERAFGGDHYKLADVRNVSYFYQDYSIHGTYWHARYGTYPQSHGCVNSTVYDAGLIYQLPAGTVVDIFREGSSSNQ